LNAVLQTLTSLGLSLVIVVLYSTILDAYVVAYVVEVILMSLLMSFAYVDCIRRNFHFFFIIIIIIIKMNSIRHVFKVLKSIPHKVKARNVPRLIKREERMDLAGELEGQLEGRFEHLWEWQGEWEFGVVSEEELART
jgi:hypothetical protein